MKAAPVWVLVFEEWRGSEQFIVACDSERDAADTVFHNTYYGRRCLIVRVKEWRL